MEKHYEIPHFSYSPFNPATGGFRSSKQPNPCTMMGNQFSDTNNSPMYTCPPQNSCPHAQSIPNVLTLIQNAIEGETEDRMSYEYLLANATSEEDKKIINGIRCDEIKHYNYFRQLYYQLTGQVISAPSDTPFTPPATYCDGLKDAIYGEQGAVQKYRNILFQLHNRMQINMLIEIITDEIRHGSLYNYLYAKNGCSA